MNKDNMKLLLHQPPQDFTLEIQVIDMKRQKQILRLILCWNQTLTFLYRECLDKFMYIYFFIFYQFFLPTTLFLGSNIFIPIMLHKYNDWHNPRHNVTWQLTFSFNHILSTSIISLYLLYFFCQSNIILCIMTK